MTETLPRLLLRLSEAGEPAILWGRPAAAHAGPGFERLLEHGVLVEQATATEWDVCPTCDCDLGARPIQQINGHHVAVCPMDRHSDTALSSNDLRSFQICPQALAREIARASGLTSELAPVTPGVWHLGPASGRALFLVLARGTALQPGLISLLRSVARAMPITLIAPKMAADILARFTEADILVVSTQDCLGADAAGFAIDPAALQSTPVFEPRLVVFRQSQRVILDGVELQIPQQPFKLLVSLAEAAGTRKPYLPPQTIEAENSGRGAADLVRELRGALSKARECHGAALIKTRRSPSGYALALAPEEIALRP